METIVAVFGCDSILNNHLQIYTAILKDAEFVFKDEQYHELTQEQYAAIANTEQRKAIFSVGTPVCAYRLEHPSATGTFESLQEDLDFAYGSTDTAKVAADLKLFFLTFDRISESNDQNNITNQNNVTSNPSEEDLQRFLTTNRAVDGSNRSLNEVLTEGLIALCRAKPEGPEAATWLADWLLRHNPNVPKIVMPTPIISSQEDDIVEKLLPNANFIYKEASITASR